MGWTGWDRTGWRGWDGWDGDGTDGIGQDGMDEAGRGWMGQLSGAAAWWSPRPGPIAGGCLSPGGLKQLPVAGSISRGRSGRSAWACAFLCKKAALDRGCEYGGAGTWLADGVGFGCFREQGFGGLVPNRGGSRSFFVSLQRHSRGDRSSLKTTAKQQLLSAVSCSCPCGRCQLAMRTKDVTKPRAAFRGGRAWMLPAEPVSKSMAWLRFGLRLF